MISADQPLDFHQVMAILNSGDHDAHVRLRSFPIKPSVWEDVLPAEPWVRESIVLHKDIPDDVLHRLATDPSERVRNGVAMKNKLKPATMLLLARDPDEGIRGGLCGHKNVTLEALEVLKNDASKWVARKARARLASPDA